MRRRDLAAGAENRAVRRTDGGVVYGRGRLRWGALGIRHRPQPTHCRPAAGCFFVALPGPETEALRFGGGGGESGRPEAWTDGIQTENTWETKDGACRELCRELSVNCT